MTLESLHSLVGTEVALSDWVVISQERINLFAEASGDDQWIHVDRVRAERESPYGSTIAHGFLTLSLLSDLSRHILPADGLRLRVNYGINRVRFPAPVRADSRVRARFFLNAVQDFSSPDAGGVDLTLTVTMELEGSVKPCCVAEWVLRYYL